MRYSPEQPLSPYEFRAALGPAISELPQQTVDHLIYEVRIGLGLSSPEIISDNSRFIVIGLNSEPETVLKIVKPLGNPLRQERFNRAVRNVLGVQDMGVAIEICEIIDQNNYLSTSFQRQNDIPIEDNGQEEKAPDILAYKMLRYHGGDILEFSQRILRSSESTKFSDILFLFAQLAQSLVLLHEKGIIHRDIKDINVLIKHNNQAPPEVRLIDFDISILTEEYAEESLYSEGKCVGTAQFMSPEQMTGEQPISQMDIYSIGSTLYKSINNKVYFNQFSDQGDGKDKTWNQMRNFILNEPTPQYPKDFISNCPEEIARIVCKAMAFNATDRYQTAQEMLADIIAYLDKHPSKYQTEDCPIGVHEVRPQLPQSISIEPPIAELDPLQKHLPSITAEDVEAAFPAIWSEPTTSQTSP